MEALRQKALQARVEALAQVPRNKADNQVDEAKAALEKDKAAAQAGLQTESGKLAAEIIRIVLHPGTAPVPARGGR